MKIGKKGRFLLKCSLLLLLILIWLDYRYSRINPFKNVYYRLFVAMLFSVSVIFTFSYSIKKQVLVPISLLIMGGYMILRSFLGKGFGYLFFLFGTSFAFIAIVIILFFLTSYLVSPKSRQ